MTQLRRSLGAMDATALVVGCVIGAGIFRTAASIAGYLHSPGQIMAVWLAGGIISFCGALCYAELGAAYPKTGGDFVYLAKAYGRGVGFVFGWTKIFTERVGTIAVLGFVFAEYLGFLLPYGAAGTKWAAAAAIGLLTLANAAGIQVGKEVQNLFAAIKVLALLGIIAVGAATAGAVSSSDVLRVESMDPTALSSFGVALVFVLWTYGGWTESSYVAEEIRDPERNLPLSILAGLALVTALYLAVNWVYLTHIPLSEMPGRPLVAAEVMRAALGSVGGGVTALMVACSAFGALNGYILTSGRILLALGREYPLYSRLAKIHPRSAAPARALWFNGLLAVLLVGWGTFDQIVTYSTVAISIFFAMAAFAVVVLRIRDPGTPRPYRVWGYPVTPLLFVAAMLAFIVNIVLMQPKETLVGLGLAALGIPLYFWPRRPLIRESARV
ncbi:MAG: amino acid permease [Candidatus Omnitrophica bacterium]|nr:amino acid permease [Candidatus Omnitrophota bacterium]